MSLFRFARKLVAKLITFFSPDDEKTKTRKHASAQVITEPTPDIVKTRQARVEVEQQRPSIDYSRARKKIDPQVFYKWAEKDSSRWDLLKDAYLHCKKHGISRVQDNLCNFRGERIIEMRSLSYGQYITFPASNLLFPDREKVEILMEPEMFEKYIALNPGWANISPVPALPVTTQTANPLPARVTFYIDESLFRPSWQQFAKILADHHIHVLYHVTDRANLDSIKKLGGLYSWWYCGANGIVIARSVANDLSRTLDRRKGLEDYVRLSFSSCSPMMDLAKHEGRLVDPCTLEISPEVIFWGQTMFSNMNATATSARIGSGIEDFKKIDFEIVTSPYYSEENKSLYQAEVLVKTHIPLKFILNLP
jgi:hypothetical protein